MAVRKGNGGWHHRTIRLWKYPDQNQCTLKYNQSEWTRVIQLNVRQCELSEFRHGMIVITNRIGHSITEILRTFDILRCQGCTANKWWKDDHRSLMILTRGVWLEVYVATGALAQIASIFNARRTKRIPSRLVHHGIREHKTHNRS